MEQGGGGIGDAGVTRASVLRVSVGGRIYPKARDRRSTGRLPGSFCHSAVQSWRSKDLGTVYTTRTALESLLHTTIDSTTAFSGFLPIDSERLRPMPRQRAGHGRSCTSMSSVPLIGSRIKRTVQRHPNPSLSKRRWSLRRKQLAAAGLGHPMRQWELQVLLQQLLDIGALHVIRLLDLDHLQNLRKVSHGLPMLGLCHARGSSGSELGDATPCPGRALEPRPFSTSRGTPCTCCGCRSASRSGSRCRSS